MRVLAVGGGFSGTAFAIHLLRLAQQKISLTLLDRRGVVGEQEVSTAMLESFLCDKSMPAGMCRTGEGAAYGTKRREHVLNVPVKKMSCIPDLPDHLLKVSNQTNS